MNPSLSSPFISNVQDVDTLPAGVSSGFCSSCA